MIAAAAGQNDVISALLSAGADVSKQYLAGDNALILAAAGGNLVAVNLLLVAGADVNTQNLQEVTAIVAAAANDHFQVVEALSAAGARAPDAGPLRRLTDPAEIDVLNQPLFGQAPR